MEEVSILPAELLYTILSYIDTDVSIVLYQVSQMTRNLLGRYLMNKDDTCYSFNEIYIRSLYSLPCGISNTRIINEFWNLPTINKGQLKIYYKLVNKYNKYLLWDRMKENLEFIVEDECSNWQYIFYYLTLWTKDRTDHIVIGDRTYLKFMKALPICSSSKLILQKMVSYYLPTVFTLWIQYGDTTQLNRVSKRKLENYIDDIIITDFVPAAKKIDYIMNGNVWRKINKRYRLFPKICKYLRRKTVPEPETTDKLNCHHNYIVDDNVLERAIALDNKKWICNYVWNCHSKKNMLKLLYRYRSPKIMKIINKDKDKDIYWFVYEFIPYMWIDEFNADIVSKYIDLDIMLLSEKEARFYVTNSLVSDSDKIFLKHRYPSISSEISLRAYMNINIYTTYVEKLISYLKL